MTDQEILDFLLRESEHYRITELGKNLGLVHDRFEALLERVAIVSEGNWCTHGVRLESPCEKCQGGER